MFFVKGEYSSTNTKSLVSFWNDGVGNILDLVADWPSEPDVANRWLRFYSASSPTNKGTLRGSVRQTNAISGADSRALYNDDAATGAGGVVGTSNAQYVSGGADYAEWIECGDPSEWSDMFNVEDYEAFVESRRGTGLLGLLKES